MHILIWFASSFSLKLGWFYLFVFLVEAKLETNCNFLLMFCPFLLNVWVQGIFFFCCRELMNHWSQDWLLLSLICAVAYKWPIYHSSGTFWCFRLFSQSFLFFSIQNKVARICKFASICLSLFWNMFWSFRSFILFWLHRAQFITTQTQVILSTVYPLRTGVSIAKKSDSFYTCA